MKNLIIFILLIQFLESDAQQRIEISFVENQDNSVSFNYKKNVSGSYLVVLDFSNLSGFPKANTTRININTNSSHQ